MHSIDSLCEVFTRSTSDFTFSPSWPEHYTSFHLRSVFKSVTEVPLQFASKFSRECPCTKLNNLDTLPQTMAHTHVLHVTWNTIFTNQGDSNEYTWYSKPHSPGPTEVNILPVWASQFHLRSLLRILSSSSPRDECLLRDLVLSLSELV
jgi:hypothetical protein